MRVSGLVSPGRLWGFFTQCGEASRLGWPFSFPHIHIVLPVPGLFFFLIFRQDNIML